MSIQRSYLFVIIYEDMLLWDQSGTNYRSTTRSVSTTSSTATSSIGLLDMDAARARGLFCANPPKRAFN